MATSFYNLPILSSSSYTQFLFISFFSLCLLPSTNSVHFKIPSFDTNTANILYEGDAVPSVGVVELINKLTYTCRVGRAVYADSVLLWDKNTRKLSDFTTHFSFIIDTQGRSSYGNGFAFFLAPVGFQIPPNSVGGFLGLFNTTTSFLSTNQIVSVEFDSYPNTDWDPIYEHVGINNNSIASAITTPWNASFHSGDTADAWINYNATTKNLSVSWTYRTTTNSQENSSLSYQIDLMEILSEWVTVGFSAATGQNIERHQLLSWEFSSSLDIKEANGRNSKKIRLVVGITLAFGSLIAGGIAGLFLILRRKKRQMRGETAEKINLTSINDDLERGAGPRRFSYEDLALATNNFSNERKLGQGGFGAVYRGYMNNLDMAVAVKKISSGSRQGKKEYIAEVKTIGRLRHRNLVQLIGWCHDKGEFLLIYEFMPNGSLDSHLFGKKSPLTWAVRYKIAHGLASALLYLHEEWEKCVVHRDIKSSNVMLDSSFSVKLGDFGLARLIDHEQGAQTTGVAGTVGYLAPECMSTGKASKESDVFSFGVVALEIATGRKSVDQIGEESQMRLVEWAWDLYGRGDLLLGVDKRLQDKDFNEREVVCLMIVGLWCAHPDSSVRPSIRQAIQVLNFETAMPVVSNMMPLPMYHVPPPTVSSGEANLSEACSHASCSYTSLDVGR